MSTFHTTGNGTYTFVFHAGPPRCGCGRGVATLRLPTGTIVCTACVEEHNRRVVIENAEQWLTAAFMATAPDQRQRLYRALSSVFHPDVGGDERVMQALNAIKARMG